MKGISAQDVEHQLISLHHRHNNSLGVKHLKFNAQDVEVETLLIIEKKQEMLDCTKLQ